MWILEHTKGPIFTGAPPGAVDWNNLTAFPPAGFELNDRGGRRQQQPPANWNTTTVMAIKPSFPIPQAELESDAGREFVQQCLVLMEFLYDNRGHPLAEAVVFLAKQNHLFFAFTSPKFVSFAIATPEWSSFVSLKSVCNDADKMTFLGQWIRKFELCEPFFPAVAMEPEHNRAAALESHLRQAEMAVPDGGDDENNVEG